MDSGRDTSCEVGCPIRRSWDQSLLAAPPSFSQRATSFVASWRQGIHQMPLLSSTRPSGNRTKAAGAAAGRQKRQPTKSIPMLSGARPQTEKAGVRLACQRPLAQKGTRVASTPVPASGLRHHFTMEKSGSPEATSRPAVRDHRRHQVRARRGRRGRGVPCGFRGPDRPGRASCPRPGSGAMVGLGRLERPTSRLSGVRSNQLSYRPESHARSTPPGRPSQDGAVPAGDPWLCEGTCRRRWRPRCSRDPVVPGAGQGRREAP